MEPPFNLTTNIGPEKKQSVFSTVLVPLWSVRRSHDEPAGLISSASSDPKLNFPMEGLRVFALSNFIAICGGEKKIKNLSTRQVVEKFILPVTRSMRSSYCDLVKTRDPSVIDTAAVYISHCWGARFLDTYRAIRYHFRNAPGTVIWMDIFCLDQRVFYNCKSRNNKNSLNEEGDYASLEGQTTTGGSDVSFFSPGNGKQNHRTQSAPSPGDYSVTDDHATAVSLEYPPSSGIKHSGHLPSTPVDMSRCVNIHHPQGAAGDWCADILKHGMDNIGNVLLVLNPTPNPEAQTDSSITSAAAQRGAKLGRALSAVLEDTGSMGSPDTATSPRSQTHWDKSRYTNANNALSRLWCLYEIYCTTVVRSRTPPASTTAGAHSTDRRDSRRPTTLASMLSPREPQPSQHGSEDRNTRPLSTGSRPNSSGGRPRSSSSRDGAGPDPRLGPRCLRPRTDTQCTFDIALHYSVLGDSAEVTNTAILKNKRSPFAVDVQATCRDFEHLTKWICSMELEHCQATDSSDAKRLLHIINVDIGAAVFFETVQHVLDTWVTETLSEVSADIPIDVRSKHNSNNTTNTVTNKNRLFIQYTMCKLFHIKGDEIRAEGAMIELGEQQQEKFGSQNPEYVDSLHYLAEFYLQQKRYSDAEPLLIESLQRRKHALGERHPDTIISIDTLADLYDTLGCYHLAEPLYEECHELRKLTLGTEHALTLKSMFSIACMMFNQEEYSQAEELMRRCLDLRRSALGANHLDTIASLQKLSVLYEIVHNYPAAELVYHEYLHASIALYGADHVYTVDALYLLGSCYRNQLKYNLAEQLYRVSVERYRTALGADHECTMRVMVDLAALYEDLALYEQSLDVRNSYFALCKAKYGEESAHKTHNSMFRTTADLHIPINTIEENRRVHQQDQDCRRTHQCMYDLAGLHIKMGKCTRALPLLKRCLELRLRYLGVTHLDTLSTQNMLAVVHINSGNYDEAEALLVHVIEEGGKLATQKHTESSNNRPRHAPLQPEHSTALVISTDPDSLDEPPPLPVVLDAMNNLGTMYCELGKLQEAEALFMSVWQSHRQMHEGDQHPDLLTVVHNLGALYAKQRKLEMAEFFYTDCLKKRSAVLGPLHPATLQTLCSIAAVQTSMGHYDVAEHMIQENQAQCTAVLGPDHPLTLRHTNALAANCEAQGNLRKAELLYKQCLVKRRLSLGASHPETLSSSNNLAALYVTQLQQLREAERMLKECLKARQSTVGLRHPATLSTVNNLATLYMRCDKTELAHDVYIDCTEECVEQLGRAHPVTMVAMENLQELVGRLGREQEDPIATLEVNVSPPLPHSSAVPTEKMDTNLPHIESPEHSSPKTRRKAKPPAQRRLAAEQQQQYDHGSDSSSDLHRDRRHK